MTAPQGLRVMSIGQLGTPAALGKEIFDRSRDGVFPIQIEPELPPASSVVDGGQSGSTLPVTLRSPAQAASEATANAAHALTVALGDSTQQVAAFEQATNVFRDMWSKGKLLDNPAPAQAAAIARCHDAFAGAAAGALEGALDGDAANPLATALTWALLGRDGQRFVGLAQQLQASDALRPEVKADLASAIGLMRQ